MLCFAFQVVQESIAIPGTALHLVYHSSRAGGYLSTIQLQLTPETIPLTLRLIHLKISIEGILFEKKFEADPGIKFTYAWNRRNVYRQKVYGVAIATGGQAFIVFCQAIGNVHALCQVEPTAASVIWCLAEELWKQTNLEI